MVCEGTIIRNEQQHFCVLQSRTKSKARGRNVVSRSCVERKYYSFCETDERGVVVSAGCPPPCWNKTKVCECLYNVEEGGGGKRGVM
jgi:hypothetical protein